MNVFDSEFNTAGGGITVASVEHRRHTGRAMQTFRAARDAALDLGAGKREAVLAAARAVKEIHGIDLLAALGFSASGEGNGGRGAPPRSPADDDDDGPGRLFSDLPDAEIGPDFADALDRLAEIWRVEPNAPREAGDEPFVDDAGLLAVGADARFARDLARAMARNEHFTAHGWTDDPALDPDHGGHRAAMLVPGFIREATGILDLMAMANYGRQCGSRPGRTFIPPSPAAVAAAVVLGLVRGPDGTFRVPPGHDRPERAVVRAA